MVGLSGVMIGENSFKRIGQKPDDLDYRQAITPGCHDISRE